MKLKKKLTGGNLMDYFDHWREWNKITEEKQDPAYAGAKVIVPAVLSDWFEDVKIDDEDKAIEFYRGLDLDEIWPLVNDINDLYAKHRPPNNGADPN